MELEKLAEELAIHRAKKASKCEEPKEKIGAMVLGDPPKTGIAKTDQKGQNTNDTPIS